MKRAISIMLVAAMCMSLFGSAVLAVPSKVQIHIDGDKPEGTVKVSVGDAIKETGESNGEHITIDRDPGCCCICYCSCAFSCCYVFLSVY